MNTLDLLSKTLQDLKDPVSGLVLADSRARWEVHAEGEGCRVVLQSGYPLAPEVVVALRPQIEAAAAAHGVGPVRVEVRHRIAAHAVQAGLAPATRVRNVIAVGSGKGGVGKSTTAVNLALALQRLGARVGVLDADVYGPSVPAMLGLSGRPESPDDKSIEPMRAFGVEAMSIGLLVDADTPMIWRGPMATSALTQLFADTRWGDLDYLLIDLPPGTGDIQLTLAQKIPVAGAVIVTTPQEIATLDARKALKMFEKVHVPVLGIVENMAVHVCSNCGHAEHLFGQGGGQAMAAQYGVPLLGSLPLDLRIREQGDAGTPVVAAAPDSAPARAYLAAAQSLAAHLAGRPRASIPISATLA
ncbi:iron-sulfur cluster carrier protein ApbC [Pseudoxanthomonas daejeonensis]|uniref:iron-sulfur cluster carrier protein ApbC n=1 Tax=Pseudoxanthomonas daejeonensis TaxID=266062 RepID=UPI001F547F5C|nr:iron-sulfur cluster carrier protein ApbC [Pseudoxanthomonas daejeonensis]UNK57691.1 iron-sulfur cluster carrier protein ApbC [Pseudoxanthomonas daejeonensis]